MHASDPALAGQAYGPYLIVQDIPPLRIPLRQDPESGLLLHAVPREKYTTFATGGEASACIARDAGRREDGKGDQLGGELQILRVDAWEAEVEDRRQRRSKKGKAPDESR